jgi:hypothetical protein
MWKWSKKRIPLLAHVPPDAEASLAFLQRHAPLWAEDATNMLCRPVRMRLSKDLTALKWHAGWGRRDLRGTYPAAPALRLDGIACARSRSGRSHRR